MNLVYRSLESLHGMRSALGAIKNMIGDAFHALVI
jgi:hypothetical protein